MINFISDQFISVCHMQQRANKFRLSWITLRLKLIRAVHELLQVQGGVGTSEWRKRTISNVEEAGSHFCFIMEAKFGSKPQSHQIMKGSTRFKLGNTHEFSITACNTIYLLVLNHSKCRWSVYVVVIQWPAACKPDIIDLATWGAYEYIKLIRSA